jgi:fido (protein-threonine AMPylation protein)
VAADWDDDSPRLHANLSAVLDKLAADAPRRRRFSVEHAREWQRRTMAGLQVPDASYVGAFRGEPGLEDVEVVIGTAYGVAAAEVAAELAAFESTLTAIVERLDARYPDADDLDADGLEAVIELAAWAHSEWVRIHPFANGNGRTARLWANAIFMRYGIEPVIRLRPRPAHGYGAAGAAAMRGDWHPTAAVFRRLLAEHYGTRRPLRSRKAPPKSGRKAPPP